MRNALILVALLVAIFGGGALWQNFQKPEIIDLAAPIKTSREAIPDFTFTDQTGASHRLSDYRGHDITINVFASWCTPCAIEMPSLLAFARKNSDMKLLLLSVDHDEKALDAFFEKHGWILPANAILVWDKDKKLSKDTLGTIRYPESYIIDKEGFLTRKIAGAIEWEDVQLGQ